MPTEPAWATEISVNHSHQKKPPNSHCSHTQAQAHKRTIESSLKADTFSFSSHWNFVTDGVLMDGQRKDATHSTIWLMPRPLLMNYAKLCPRERSHMFIMKAAGVLDIPWVAPNELRVTGQHDTQYHAAKGRKTHTHTKPSLVLLECVHLGTLTELWRHWFSVAQTILLWTVVLSCKLS